MPVALLAVMAASAIAQWYNSDQARKASKDQMSKMQALYDKLQQPNLDPTTITPEDYKLVGQYVPEAAAHIQEINPTLPKLSETGQLGQQAQKAALQKYQQIASSSENPELQAMTQQALQQSNAAAQSRSASLMDQYARQGMLNSGSQLAAQLSGNEGAMTRGAEAGQNAAIEAYRQRLAALQGSAQLGGQMESQDQQMQGQNAAIINAFNQRNAASGQNYANYVAGLNNSAQQTNLANQQQTANMNTQQKNQAAIDQQRYLNSLKQQGYQDQLAAIQGKQGIASQNIGMINQQAADKNSLYQGIGNAGVAAGMSYQQGQQNDAANARADKALQMQQDYNNWKMSQPQSATTNVSKGPVDIADEDENNNIYGYS